MNDRVTIRLDHETLKKLNSLADRKGLTISDTIRELINTKGDTEGITELSAKVDAISSVLNIFCTEKTLRHIARASVAAVQPYILAGKTEEAKVLNNRISDAAEKVVFSMLEI